MTAFETLRDELRATWYRDIPLVAAIGVEIATCSPTELAVRAPLAPNRNLQGTAFAGSLYSVCVLTGWGAAWLALRHAGLTATLVVAESRIDYRRAVPDEIVCRCVTDEAAVRASFEQLASIGRTDLPLTCTIDARNRRAVTFDATYAIRSKAGR